MRRLSLVLAVIAGTGGVLAGDGPAYVPAEALDRQLTAQRVNRNTCGPVSLWFAMRYAGHQVDLNEVLAHSDLEDRGIRLDQLVTLSDKFGMPGRAVEFSPSAATFDTLPVPALLVVRDSHCVTYLGRNPETGECLIFEPVTGEQGWDDPQRLGRLLTGVGVVFSESKMPLWRFGLMTSTCMLTVVLFAWWWISAQFPSRNWER